MTVFFLAGELVMECTSDTGRGKVAMDSSCHYRRLTRLLEPRRKAWARDAAPSVCICLFNRADQVTPGLCLCQNSAIAVCLPDARVVVSPRRWGSLTESP